MSQNRRSELEGIPVPIQLTGDVAFACEEYGPKVSIPTHWHDVDQLIYASSGVATVGTDDGIWVVPPARALWVPAATSHHIEMTGEVRLISVYVRPKIAPIDRSRCCVVHVSSLMREVILRSSTTGEIDSGTQNRRVAVLFDEIGTAGIAPLELVIPTDQRARDMANSFLADPSQRRSRAEWAREVGTSERTLERLFLQETNTTVGRWQRQARLLEALRLLAMGHDVNCVAFDVGFDTPSAFIAMFRRALGTTPGRYFSQTSERTDPES